MNSFIEEFYYGNIDPQARSFEQNPKVQRDMEILTNNEDFLMDTVKGVADTEHQRDTDEGRCPSSGEVQYKERAVINRVCNNRLEQHVIRFAPAVKGTVKDILKGIQDIESKQHHNQSEKLIYIGICKQNGLFREK